MSEKWSGPRVIPDATPTQHVTYRTVFYVGVWVVATAFIVWIILR